MSATAKTNMLEVQVLPLVPNVALPAPAPAATRQQIPSGYGVQEHCLPFTAAAALGFLIKSPISFGLCLPGDVPPTGHKFRSPLEQSRSTSDANDARVFYVKDDPNCRFVNNAFTCDSLEISDFRGKQLFTPVQPGISFFDREDQHDLFKLHLPYIWRTPPEIDALFLPAINRSTHGFTIVAGLVETDWYANPVNMVLGKPSSGQSVHIEAGDTIAQVIFLARSYRRPELRALASHAHMARGLRAGLVEWYRQHAKDRAAYKKLARSQHGRIGAGKSSPQNS